MNQKKDGETPVALWVELEGGLVLYIRPFTLTAGTPWRDSVEDSEVTRGDEIIDS